MLQQVWSYIAKNQHAIWLSLLQHIEISALAAIITIIIAIPLAVALLNHRRAGEFVLQVASVIQTIPSLAILGLLIPIVGIGTVPAVIALVLYALMPIFSNTYAGMTNIDPVLLEAADALGVSRRFRLFRILFPLAMPMILSGIRIGVVMIIGTATLAALIGGGGLGTYILLGIQTNNNAALIVGALLAAVLALLASWLIRVLSKVPLKRLLIGLVALIVVGGGVYGVRAVTAPKTTNVTIAGKMGGEPEVLINMYKELIEQDNSNVHVTVKANFGGTSFLFKALKSGKVDVYPEFTGTVLQSLVKGDQTVSHNQNKAYQSAKQALSKQFGMTYLRPMQYQNDYALAVTKATAQKYHLQNFEDLVGHPELIAGFDPDFYAQEDGYPGLKKAYGLNFTQVKTMEPSLRYEALAKGRIGVTDAYTTDPQLRQYHLVVLKDTKHFFPSYQGAPLMKTQFTKQHPEVVRSLRKLSGRITTADMQEMNYEVTVQHKKASTVARQYLRKAGLLK